MVDPGEEYPEEAKPILKTDQFIEIYSNLADQTAKNLLQSQFADQDEFKTDLLVVILQEFGNYIID